MSSGKLRRERSGSRERRSRREGDTRREAAPDRQERKPDVPELNEEEYDEEWEHEWEDIDEIGKGNNKFQKSYGRGQNQRWRGRGQTRWQPRFNKWDYKNREGSENGSESNRRSGRRSAVDEEDENLEMPPGVEMTNLKVKIQDGKRFAEPEEREEFERSSDMRNHSRFSRGRGSRGHSYAGRDRWTQGNRYKHPAANDDLLDCREVLNRRKRHYPDPSESDLREKLLRKDSDLGDLREIIESRDPGVVDLRDIIEPPDMSMIDEFTEDVVGEVDLEDGDLNLRIRNDLYDGSVDDNDHGRFIREGNDFEPDGVRYEYLEDQDIIEDIAATEVHHGKESLHPREVKWGRNRWRRSRSRSHERNFDQNDEWPKRERAGSFQEEEWRNPRRLRGSPSEERELNSRITPQRIINEDIPRGRSPDLSRNKCRERVNRSRERIHRSREGIRSPPARNMRERSFERLARPRKPSWERERNFSGPRGDLPRGDLPLLDREANQRMERRGSFEGEIRMGERDISPGRGRAFSPPRHELRRLEDDRQLSINDARRPGREMLRSPPSEPGRQIGRGRERSIGRERSLERVRSISREGHRFLGREQTRTISQERNRGMRSVSVERGRIMGRERIDPERMHGIDRESHWSTDREGNRSVDLDRNKSLDTERNTSFDHERDRSLVQQRNRSLERERNRSLERDRNRTFEQDRNRVYGRERNRDFDQDRKSVGRDVERNVGWEQGRDRGTKPEREINMGRGRERSPHWVGPRTPSIERYRGPSWEKARSPHRSRDRSSPRERIRSRSRSRGREPDIPTGRVRDHSRGTEIQERKDKGTSRLKEQDVREKTQDQTRRRDFNQRKDQDPQSSKAREIDPEPHRNMPKESNSNMKNRKRDHEENISKDRGRERRRSPDQRNLQEKTSKKLSQPLKEDYKQRFVRENDKPEKFNRREEFQIKSNKDNHEKKSVGGHNQNESKEWEKIRDFQERRNVPPVGLPFLDEARRHKENASREQQLRNHGNHMSRNHSVPFSDDRRPAANAGDHQKKKSEVLNWLNQGLQQAFSRPEEERRRPSRWGSPTRRDKPSEHIESRKPAPHPLQSVANPHHSASNGKGADDFRQRRELASFGESQWNKPRSDLPYNPPKDVAGVRPYIKSLQSPREVIFVRGLARDVSEMDIRHDISNCGLWAKDVRIVQDSDSGLSRGLAFITFNSVDEATRWMDVRKGVLNLRQNNHAPMDFSNPISKDWECVRCHTTNFKHRLLCYQCNRSKDDCLDGWEETCPYPTNALLLRGLNPSTTTADVVKALKPRLLGQARLDGVKMAQDSKGRPRSVCFVQLPSVVDSMGLHKSLINEPIMIDNNQVIVAYCQLDKLPAMETQCNPMHPSMAVIPPAIPPAIPLSLPPTLPSNNIPVVSRSSSTPVAAVKPLGVGVSTATIRSMLEGNYAEKDIPILAQYCASAYAKNPQEQSAYVRYYTKLYKDKLKSQSSGK